MRVVIQRVKNAKVEVNQKNVGSIKQGLLVFLGIEMADTIEDVNWIIKKTTQIRIFSDSDGIMNRSLLDIDGELLLISQFTLMAATKKGNRPSYIRAAKHEHAIPLYEAFISQVEKVLKQAHCNWNFWCRYASFFVQRWSGNFTTRLKE